jgi:Tfp pilus assembly protein PilN
VRPVNLLPQNARPYQASGKSGGAYILLAVLGVLVVGALGYVLTVNQITTKKNDITVANNAAQAANAKVSGLQQYAQFAQVAQARITSVAALATSRIDYERLLRETARVLPSGVWLSQLDAESNDGAGSSSSSASTATSTTGTNSPTVHLLGCAPSQDTVATMLVRLRAIHGYGDVQLNDSGRALSATSASSSVPSGGAGGDCGSKFSFDVMVTLTPQVTGAGEIGQKVPSSLGGGA